MNLQSLAGARSSRFLGKPASSYCCAHWLGQLFTEMTVIAAVGGCSSWPLGWPANEHSSRSGAVPHKTSNRGRRRPLHEPAGAGSVQ